MALSLTRLLQWKLPSVTFDFFYCSQGNFPCSREPTDSYVQLVLVHFRIGIAHYSVSITRTKNSFQATPVDRGTANASDGSTDVNARSSTNSPSTPVHRRMYTAAGTLSITHSGVNSSVSAGMYALWRKTIVWLTRTSCSLALLKDGQGLLEKNLPSKPTSPLKRFTCTSSGP